MRGVWLYILGCVLVSIALAVYVLTRPNASLTKFETIPVKAALFLTSQFVLLHLSWSLFWMFYQPPPWRMYLRAFQFTMFLGLLVSSGPPIFAMIERLQVSADVRPVAA